MTHHATPGRLAPDMPHDHLPDALDLSGIWRAGIANEDLRRIWYSDDFDDADFVDLAVPGHWQSSAPFAQNHDALLYRRRFTALTPEPDTRAWLHLDGIAVQGDVWLDGTYLGNSEGAWVSHHFEITDALSARNEHTLGIEVTSPQSTNTKTNMHTLGTWIGGPYVRPTWNPGGIWRPVRVTRTGPVAIKTHRVLCTAASPTRATVSITCTLDAQQATTVTIVTCAGDVDAERTQALASGTNQVTWDIEITNPSLWWPYELGDQPLTTVSVEVFAHESHDKPGPISDQFATTCGLREIALHNWVASINGERIYLKGVLAGPAAHELGTADQHVFVDQVAHAKAAGCNLIRVHGHLSAPAFYAAADEAGMLIWQDLPLYRTHHRSVRRVALATAQAAVNALGAHPSVALWCAHDEPDLDSTQLNSDKRPTFLDRLVAHELPNWNRSVLDVALKRSLSGADPTRPVIGSSGTWPHPPALNGTDIHVAFGWHSGDTDDLDRLARTVPRAVRFVQITPSPSLPVDHAPFGETTWPHIDITSAIADGNVDVELLQDRLPPDVFDNADDWIRATHNHHGQLIRDQIETLRRIKYRPSGGYCIAQLGDLRLGMSPSIVDSSGTRKPAFAVLHAANAPVLATLSPWPTCAHSGDEIECAIHVINDLRTPLDDATVTVDVGFDDDATTWTFGGSAPADSCVHVGTIRFTVPAHSSSLTARVQLTCTQTSAANRYRAPVHVHEMDH